MRLLFAGTPHVAVPALQALLASQHEVIAVLTRPDAPTGRGRRLAPSPVAEVAIAEGIELLRPPRPSDPAFGDRLAALAPDAAPIVAYGGLIPPPALAVPRHGWINLHFSLLPAWRGAAPVQRAIIAGDQITGACTFQLEEGLDTGPIYGLLTEAIGPHDTSGGLLTRLAEAGAGLMVATMDGVESGALVPAPQAADGVSHAPKLTVEEAHVPWDAPVMHVDRLVRGCTPAPGAWTLFRGERLKLGPVRIASDPALAPGALVVVKNRVLVGTATYPVLLGDVRAMGRKQMPAGDWARGVRVEPGERLG